MPDNPTNSLMPSDDDIRRILAEVAKHNPMLLPKTLLEIQIARIIAQGFEKLMVKWNEVADELDHKFRDGEDG